MTLYDRLGVPPDATAEEIRRAYHRAIVEVHPDRRPGDADAAAQAAALGEAYAVLSDPARRTAYDRQRGAAGQLHDALGHARRNVDVVLGQAQQAVSAVDDASKALGRLWKVGRALFGRPPR